MRRLFPIAAAAAALVGAGALAGIGHMGGVECDQPPVCAHGDASCAEIAGRLPDDVDLVMVVADASRLRAGPLGAVVAKGFADGTGLAEVSRAWSRLAEQVGWTTEETFDRLLGTRLVVATRTDPRGGAAGRSWAILSEVTPATERRLFERLQAAPRAIDAGHQILSVEKGSYELTSHAGKNKDSARTIVLGPAGRSDLFDDVVRSLARSAGAPSPLGKRPVAEAAAGCCPADVLVLAALDAPATSARRWANFAVIAGKEDAAQVGAKPGLAWSSRVTVRQEKRKAELERVRATSDGAFAALAKGAMLAVVQSASVSDVLETELPLMDLFKMLPIADAPEGAAPTGANVVAVGLHTEPAPEPCGPTPRQMLAVRSVGDRTVVSVGFETRDVAKTAARMDEKIASFAGTLERQFGSTEPPPLNLAGASPGAARVLPLRLPREGPFATFLPEPLVLSWAYPSPGCREARAAGCPGWWVLSLTQEREQEPSPAALVGRECAAIVSEATCGEVGRWVWLGTAQPRALEALLPAELPDIRGFRTVMRALEFAQVRLSISQAGDIEGQARVRLAESGAAARSTR